MKKQLLIIIGPTASGKSSLAIKLAKETNGVVINADSMQIYKELPIITACPSEKDKETISHKLYQILDANEPCSVAFWIDLAIKEIENCWQNNQTPIITGGTGLYIKSLIEGLSPIPDISEEIKNKTNQLIASKGVEAAYKLLQEKDPKTAKRLPPKDLQRIRRALQVFEQTRKSITDWQQEENIIKLPKCKTTTIAILPEREKLYQRCNKRFDIMLEMGAIKEAKNFSKKSVKTESPLLKALGYPSLLEHIQGTCSLEQAIKNGKTLTRRYAKRQITFIKHQIKKDLIIDDFNFDIKNILTEL